MSANVVVPAWQCDELVKIFDREFSISQRTRLLKGGAEPVYLPAGDGVDYHRIIFTRDYFASALHEVAHWCIAGEARRQQVDFGYWYAPDGRTEAQQQMFEQVEVKPQALEWIFSTATGYRFHVSTDNLAAGLGASEAFKQNIHRQVLAYCRRGLPSRAGVFAGALAAYYGSGEPLDASRYYLSDL